MNGPHPLGNLAPPARNPSPPFRTNPDEAQDSVTLVEAILMLVTAVNQNTEAVLALADATAGVEEVKEEGGSPYLDGP